METRRHDIDLLRVVAFGLLILYHVGMVYVADWGFHVKSAHQWVWLEWPMIGVNRWRMPLIFLISGIAIGLARPGRGPYRFALKRTARLLLPLSFGIVAIVPIQAYCEAVANSVVEPGVINFMVRYLQFRPWPEGGFAGAEFGFTWNHLWYLVYLWVYTLVLLAGVAALGARGRKYLAARRLAPGNWPVWLLLSLPVAYLWICLHVIEPRYPTTHALFDDWYEHARDFAVFAFGFTVAGSSTFWERVVARRRIALGLALTGLTAYMGLRVAGKVLTPEAAADLPDLDWEAISDSAHVLYLWCALLAMLGYAKHYLDRPRSWLPYATTAVYPWYILHQSLIVPLAFYLGYAGLPGWLEAMLVLGGTVAGCALLHEFVIRRVRWLRPLFGMHAVPRATSGPGRHGDAHLETEPAAVAECPESGTKPRPT